MSEGMFAAIGPCCLCDTRFSFDPDRVVVILMDPVTGLPPDLGGDPSRAEKLPVCPDCVRKLKQERAKRGLPPLPALEREV